MCELTSKAYRPHDVTEHCTVRQCYAGPAGGIAGPNGMLPAGQRKGAFSRCAVGCQEVSNNTASLALELVGYDSSLQTAMQYVFGSSFVCQVRACVPFDCTLAIPEMKPLVLKQELVVRNTS